MSQKTTYATAAIKADLHQICLREAKKRNEDVRDYESRLLEFGLDRTRYVERTFPKIEYLSTALNEMVLKDNELDKHVIVRAEKGKFQCDFHRSFKCEHIDFARVRGLLAKMLGEDLEAS